MKTKFIALCMSALAFVACDKKEPANPTDKDTDKPSNLSEMVVATYNIRNDNATDGAAGRGWDVRYNEVCKVIEKYGFDMFGIQEAVNYQVESIKLKFPQYDFIGIGRDGDRNGEYTAIIYNASKFDLLDSGNFWLSETPNEVSKGWDAQYRRICTWGKFRHKESGFEFAYFNTHLDNSGAQARLLGAKMILERMKAMSLPVMVGGDFNADQLSDPYKVFNTSNLVKDSYAMAQKRSIVCGTFNNFTIGYKYETSDGQYRRIDHLFLSPEFTVTKYAVPIDTYKDKNDNFALPADHYPVVLTVNVPKSK